MEYLTVHDLVWINNIVTGKVNPYDYVTLEACMAAQYRYGNSSDTAAQAAGLLDKLLAKRPFADGNRRTALIALLTFLNANEYATTASEERLANAVTDVAEGAIVAQEAVRSIAAPAGGILATTLALRKLITLECNAHAEALGLLTDGDA
jgi:death-on-curing family protein